MKYYTQMKKRFFIILLVQWELLLLFLSSMHLLKDFLINYKGGIGHGKILY